VKGIGAIKQTFARIRIRDVRSMEGSRLLSSNRGSSRNRVISASVIVSSIVISAKISPLKSPSSVSDETRYVNGRLAFDTISISGRARWVNRTASTNILAIEGLNVRVERSMRIRLGSR